MHNTWHGWEIFYICLMSAAWISSAQECTQSVHSTSVSCGSIMRPTGFISCDVDLILFNVLILHQNSYILLPCVRILRSYHFVHIFCVSYLYVLMHILCVCIVCHLNERPLSTVLYALFFYGCDEKSAMTSIKDWNLNLNLIKLRSDGRHAATDTFRRR